MYQQMKECEKEQELAKDASVIVCGDSLCNAANLSSFSTIWPAHPSPIPRHYICPLLVVSAVRTKPPQFFSP
jgi:hypothetical protein